MASIKEAPQPTADSEGIRQPSIIERFRRGEVSRSSVIQGTISLIRYIKDNNIPIPLRLEAVEFAQAQLGEDNPASARITYRNRSKPTGYQIHYRLDPSLADIHVLPRLRELYPGRSEVERARAQAQLLRVGVTGYHRGEMYRTITIDEAVMKLQSIGRIILRKDRNIADEVIARTFASATPYLVGERGEFFDFSQFEHFFARVLNRKKIELYRRQKREVSLEQQGERGIVYSAKPSEGENESDLDTLIQMLEPFLASMSKRDAIAFHQYIIGGMSYIDIANLDGRSVGALRILIMRLRDRMNPKRDRNRTPTNKELIAEYAEYRSMIVSARGRLPNYGDFRRLRKTNPKGHSTETFAKRFGNGSWAKARAELERLIAES